MPRIFIRVELHGLVDSASYITYQQLHAFMEAKNWSRSVSARMTDGISVSRNLPTAIYTGITDVNSLDVASALTSQIASSIWFRNTVLVMTTAESWAIAVEAI